MDLIILKLLRQGFKRDVAFSGKPYNQGFWLQLDAGKSSFERHVLQK